MVIRDIKELNEIEIKYLMALGTHVDFLIYSKTSKNVTTAVEADGYSFHKEGSKQVEVNLSINY